VRNLDLFALRHRLVDAIGRAGHALETEGGVLCARRLRHGEQRKGDQRRRGYKYSHQCTSRRVETTRLSATTDGVNRSWRIKFSGGAFHGPYSPPARSRRKIAFRLAGKASHPHLMTGPTGLTGPAKSERTMGKSAVRR